MLLECWARMDPERQGLTAAEVVERLYSKGAQTPAPDYHAPMKAAVDSLVGKGDSRLLGNKLRVFRRRIFQGRYIDHAGKEHKAVRWAVFSAAEFRVRPDMTPHTPQTPLRERDPGECGESFSNVDAARCDSRN